MFGRVRLEAEKGQCEGMHEVASRLTLFNGDNTSDYQNSGTNEGQWRAEQEQQNYGGQNAEESGHYLNP